MLTAQDKETFQYVFVGSATLVGIILAYITVLFPIYARFAAQVERPPILRVVRRLADAGIVLLFYDAAVMLLALAGWQLERPALAPVVAWLFALEVAAAPVLAVVARRKFLA